MIPNWFSGAAYLSANTDVAADLYYGQHPWEHFVSTGYIEGRTWDGDPRRVVVVQPTEPEPSDPTDPGSNSPETHTVWVDEFSGKEHSTQFSTSGDNPQFKRFRAVAYGFWAGTDKRYVYNTKYVDDGVGHVEYHPELTGRYEIRWYFRKTLNRSKKACDVRLVVGGNVVDLKAVSQYAAESDYTSTVVGTVDLTESDYIQVMPGDRKSISFGKMVFTRR